MLKKLVRNRRGQGLVEYGLLIAGVALISAAAVSVFGHKTADLISAVATILPGAHADDNAPIASGKLIETTAGSATAPISLDVSAISAGGNRLGENVLGSDTEGSFGGLVVEAGGEE